MISDEKAIEILWESLDYFQVPITDNNITSLEVKQAILKGIAALETIRDFKKYIHPDKDSTRKG